MCGRYLARSTDGRLWVSTEDGVAIVDPARSAANHSSAGHGGADAGRWPGPRICRRPRIVFRGREVQISYTGLSFSSPEGVRFRYRLDRLDRA